MSSKKEPEDTHRIRVLYKSSGWYVEYFYLVGVSMFRDRNTKYSCELLTFDLHSEGYDGPSLGSTNQVYVRDELSTREAIAEEFCRSLCERFKKGVKQGDVYHGEDESLLVIELSWRGEFEWLLNNT